jgi:hypothetical protein
MKRYKYTFRTTRQLGPLPAGELVTEGRTGLTTKDPAVIRTELMEEFTREFAFVKLHPDGSFEVTLEELDPSLAPTPEKVCALPEVPLRPWEDLDQISKQVLFPVIAEMFPLWGDVWEFPWSGNLNLQEIAEVRCHFRAEVNDPRGTVSVYSVTVPGAGRCCALVTETTWKHTRYEILIFDKAEVEALVFSILRHCTPRGWDEVRVSRRECSIPMLEELELRPWRGTPAPWFDPHARGAGNRNPREVEVMAYPNPREMILEAVTDPVMAGLVRMASGISGPAPQELAVAFKDLMFEGRLSPTLEQIARITPGGRLPSEVFLDLAGSSFGTEVRIQGFAVLLDGSRRWWASGLLRVDGAPTAILRRFGREGDDLGENLLVPGREREWRKFRTLEFPRGEIPTGGGNKRAAWAMKTTHPANSSNPSPLYVPKGRDLESFLQGEVRAAWEGWTAEQAILAHVLNLTRHGILWS